MRRMLLPEVKIKSKLKDNVDSITFEELLEHAHIFNPSFPSIKTIIIQTIASQAGDKDDGRDGGVWLSDEDVTEITNAILTITIIDTNFYINGLGINVIFDLLTTPIEDVYIQSSQPFDVYIINP